MYSEYVTHIGFFVTVGKMKEVFTGNYCDLFVVPVDLSVSAKRLSSHEIADVFNFDSNINSTVANVPLYINI